MSLRVFQNIVIEKKLSVKLGNKGKHQQKRDIIPI